ncbi:glycosyltransferase family 2 protein [Thermoanaerobacter pentosaceus]|uniref:Rhamnosyltransferase n=1 Tax=Thermoanaerobacter pentosaceus TaxID=694059 RepID=A0ABT9M5N3_9THEO|nr:glycosyltransferase family 2 protein [Thermoanaerobacter pentosaceus]MDP9751444.1 rhamnosyltransferase [Thermoanaerobacter pentosaceus]
MKNEKVLQKVHGVIVTYKPNLELLKQCIESLVYQCKKLHIIDNTPNGCLELETFKNYGNVEIIYLKDNYGIAYTQNVGIKRALEENADYILLSDQDTVYPPDFVEKMLECFKEEKVAAAGPLFIDTHTGKLQFFVKKGLLGFKRIYPKQGKHKVLQLIASGTIINAKYLPDIGLMMEALFIDWVDMEWCWRAIRKGYKIIGNADVIIEHCHGESSKKLLHKTVTLKNPVRHYYTVRNAIYLALNTNVLDLWHRILLFLKTSRNAFLFPILSKNRLKNLKYTLKGLFHGIIGRLGKLNEES